MSSRLVFVYNADAGLGAALLDAVHKVVAPATYPCSLCAVTYGAMTMRPRWRRYLAGLPLAAVFYHRQDFHAAYPALAGLRLPLVARDDDGVVRVLLDAAALARLHSLDSLIAALEVQLGSGAAFRCPTRDAAAISEP